MASKKYTKADLLVSIRNFKADSGVTECQIQFDFGQHDSRKLSERLWSQRRNPIYKSLLKNIQQKVDNVQSAAGMLEHEFMGKANGQRADIEGKRNRLYEAMIGLLDDPYFASNCLPEEDEVRRWMEKNLLDVLFDPPAPELSSTEVAARFICEVAGTVGLGAKSVAESLWGSIVTHKTENSTSKEASLRDDTWIGQADQTSATSTSLSWKPSLSHSADPSSATPTLRLRRKP